MEKGKVKRNVTLIIVIAVILFVVWFLIVYPLIDFNKKEESVLDASKKYYEKNIRFRFYSFLYVINRRNFTSRL
mgnify:CR=1 FL=1